MKVIYMLRQTENKKTSMLEKWKGCHNIKYKHIIVKCGQWKNEN